MKTSASGDEHSFPLSHDKNIRKHKSSNFMIVSFETLCGYLSSQSLLVRGPRVRVNLVIMAKAMDLHLSEASSTYSRRWWSVVTTTTVAAQ